MKLNKADRIVHLKNQIEVSHNVDERDFQRYLVLSAIAKGVRTLDELTQKCHGLYPFELRELLDEFVREDRVRLLSDQYYLTGPKIEGSKARQTVSINHHSHTLMITIGGLTLFLPNILQRC